MPLQIECPGCKATLQVADELAGKQGKCIHCGHRLTVPGGRASVSSISSGLSVSLFEATPEAMMIYTGKGTTSIGGKRIPEGGCLGQARRELERGVPAAIPAAELIRLDQETFEQAQRDGRVRQAMTMLVDRQQIIDKIRFGLGQMGISHFNPSSREFNTSLKPLPYDPQRAAQLLDEAGWKDTNGDGIRDKDGVPFKFEFLASVGSTLAPQLMVILKEELRKVGIQMTERTIDFNVMTDSLQDHQFDATTAGWTSGLVTDPYQIWHSSSSKNRGSNYVSFNNPEADRLIEQARLEFDDEKRKQIYWRFQEIIHEEQPYTFLFYGQEAAAYSKRFQNTNFVPVRPGYDLNTWFVPKLSQKYSSMTRTP